MKKQSPKFVISLVSTLVISTKQKDNKIPNLGCAWYAKFEPGKSLVMLALKICQTSQLNRTWDVTNSVGNMLVNPR